MGSLIADCFRAAQPVIGVLHLAPLPGSPRYTGDPERLRAAVLRDAEALTDGGVHGLLLENYGDAPFYPGRVPAGVVAHMTALAVAVRSRFGLPLGVNVLRNDGRSALAIAAAVGARFVRVNVLCGARVTDQGILQGIAHQLARDRVRLAAQSVMIFADVDVKHSAPLAPRPIEQEAEEALERGGADALIVSGRGTGRAVDLGQLEALRAALPHAPLLVGSGVTADNVSEYLALADGFIVGTAMKRDGITAHPVDPDRVRAIVRQVQR